jgi:hypothetical protein
MQQPPRQLSQSEAVYLRSLLLIADGTMQRRAIRTQRLMGVVFIVCALAIAALAVRDVAFIGVAVLGMIAGAAGVFRLTAKSTSYRAPVLMRICDWKRARSLLAGDETGTQLGEAKGDIHD